MSRALLTCQNPECGIQFDGEMSDDGWALADLCDDCQAKHDAADAQRHPATVIIDVLAGWQMMLDRLLPYEPRQGDVLADLVDLHVALKGVDGDRSDYGLIGHLQDFVRELDAAIVDQMGGTHDLAAGYSLERKGGTIRKQWQSDVLVKEVATRAIDRARAGDDGEVHDLTPAEAAEAVIKGLAEAAPITTPSCGWKVEGLRGLGLNPDLYCEKSRGPASVIVRKATIDEDPQPAGEEA